LLFKRIKQLLKQQRLRCTTAATALPTVTALLLGWALLEEESAAIRLAMRCTARSKQPSRARGRRKPRQRPGGRMGWAAR